jgi:hypothetical protein
VAQCLTASYSVLTTRDRNVAMQIEFEGILVATRDERHRQDSRSQDTHSSSVVGSLGLEQSSSNWQVRNLLHVQ